MPTDVIMPALGMAQDTGRVIRWLHEEGDEVQQGLPLIEIETDKVTVEIEAPASGRLAAIGARPGDDVPVGTVIALVLGPDDAAPAAGADMAPGQVVLAPAGRPAASPLARRLAADRGVDIAALAQELGRPVQAADVEHAAVAPRDGQPGRGAWQVMARRMTESWTSAPHFSLECSVDAGRLASWLAHERASGRAGLTFTDLLVRLTAAALRSHPALTSSWGENRVVPSPGINIGVAVAIDDGLLVPVIHHADTLGLRGIAERRSDMVDRARNGRLAPDDVQGGTFTVSNLGMYRVDAFRAILNPPQAAILSLGRIADRVIPVGGVPAVRPALTLTLTCDHRVVDGARAAAFLTELVELIEEPAALAD
jgi:pyruvate dehydrogenase E2 component (dihydrolipoamide acetyltransferase)